MELHNIGDSVDIKEEVFKLVFSGVPLGVTGEWEVRSVINWGGLGGEQKRVAGFYLEVCFNHTK